MFVSFQWWINSEYQVQFLFCLFHSLLNIEQCHSCEMQWLVIALTNSFYGFSWLNLILSLSNNMFGTQFQTWLEQIFSLQQTQLFLTLYYYSQFTMFMQQIEMCVQLHIHGQWTDNRILISSVYIWYWQTCVYLLFVYKWIFLYWSCLCQ